MGAGFSLGVESPRFTRPARRRRTREAIVPMINVVFLLLIFFLMTAEIAPPAPLEVTPPDAAEGMRATRAPVFYLDARGVRAFGDLRGSEAVAAAVTASEGGALILRVDRDAPAAALTRLLGDLARAGAGEVSLVTGARP